MVKAVQALDQLQARAYELYTSGSPASDFLKLDNTHSMPYIPRSTEDVVQMTQSINRVHSLVGSQGRKMIGPPTSPETGNEDLIDIELRE